MKKYPALLLLLISMTAPWARAADVKAAAGSPLAPLAPLVGGVWIGEVPVPKGEASLKLEARFAWTENKQGVRFDSVFVRGDKRSPYTSGQYGWDGAKGKLVIFYCDSGGSLTTGTITQESGVLVNDLLVSEAGGKTYPVQVRLTKTGADGFTNEIFLQKDGAWAPFVTVRYEREN